MHQSRQSLPGAEQSPAKGAPPVPEAEAPRTYFASVSPGYFGALGIPIREGRDFSDLDIRGGQRVAVINETFARVYLEGENAIGRRFTLSNQGDDWLEVVGVVRDGKYRSLSEDPQPFAFVSLDQNYTGLTKLVARTANGTGGLLERMRHEVNALNPDMPVFDAQTLTEHMRLPLFIARIAGVLFGTFGSLALVLAALGIFGVVSFTVSRRTREIGIRTALGARNADLLRMVVFKGMKPVFAGMAAGIAVSLALTRLLKEFLFGVSATDPLTFVGIVLLLSVVALVACYLPARRALTVDPLAAIRHD